MKNHEKSLGVVKEEKKRKKRKKETKRDKKGKKKHVLENRTSFLTLFLNKKLPFPRGKFFVQNAEKFSLGGSD